ncbi:MAG: hypothetical protein LJE60_13805, partial [Thiocapsa sp.]
SHLVEPSGQHRVVAIGINAKARGDLATLLGIAEDVGGGAPGQLGRKLVTSCYEPQVERLEKANKLTVIVKPN